MSKPPKTGDDVVPELSELFDDRLLSYYEHDSLQKRLENLRRVVAQVVEAQRHLAIPRDLPAPGDDAPTRDSLLRSVMREVVRDSQPELKRQVTERMMDGIGRHYLWSNLSSLPVFHEISALVPWWMVNNLPAPVFREIADLLSREVLHGIVLSLQRVQEEVLESEQVFLGHCVCRSSGIAHDLEQDGRVFTLLGEDENRLLLDRLVDRYVALGSERVAESTSPRYREILDRLVRLRASGSDDYRLESFLRWTYPDWEILPVRRGYTARWIRSMQNNRKCEPVDREIVFEMANIMYLSRGAVFNSMKAVSSRYTICTCPTPENEGGCILTNWYYYGRMNNSLIPADDHSGRRRDSEGRVLRCRYFPVRARRECIGCGCPHELERPRDLHRILAEADATLARYTSA